MNILKKFKKNDVVIIEDNIYYSKLIKANILKNKNKNVLIFNDGEEALNFIKQKKPKCVILDHILSINGLNGNDVLKKIKEISNKINVIIISGQDDINVATDYMKLGAYDYIIKNDKTFFYLENSLIKLDRILLNSNNKILIYYILIILIIFGILLIKKTFF